MKKYMAIVIAMIFCSVFLCACDNSGGCDVGNTIELTQEDNGQTIEMNYNDTIKVVLSSNPTTGYGWVNMLTDGGIIVQEGDAVYQEDPDCAGRDGCGGTETFYFEAVESGDGAIKLAYMRTWENEPIKEFEVTVSVE